VLRRLAAVGALVTAVDLAIVVVLRAGAGLPVIIADAIAIGVAAPLSLALHRAFTFQDDPRARLVREPGPFLRVALLGGVVDIVVLRVWINFVPLFGAKLIALALAAAVRVVCYRALLVSRVRNDQSRRTERDRAAPPGEVRFSVVIPAYREEARIAKTLSALRGALSGIEHEVVVVDDGSDDATAEEARRAGADQVVVQPENRGKGAAVRAGVLAARGRAIAFTDADLAYPPAQLVRLLEQVEAGWDMVVGSRRHVDTTTLVRARRVRELSGRLFNLFTLLVLLGQYRDTQCGLKAFRADAAKRIFSAARIDGFAFDVEVFHLAERYRLSLCEVPVALANTETSTVRVGVDAGRMVRDLIRIRRLASTGAYEGVGH
jgi:dolichyl-phosphate beta-glucosyltransferase